MTPKVTVVCLCYNHRPFVEEAIESVLAQTYSPLEIILVDDGSTDGSLTVLQELVRSHPQLRLLASTENRGNCAAFNLALKEATGDFIIDFATDDVMLPNRIARQVEAFQSSGEDVGMVFTNADYIDEAGGFIRNHTRHLIAHDLIRNVPQGWVFQDVLRRYFICSPTMMMRTSLLRDLGGYDERLAYEDFDFWVRASKRSQFIYLDEVLTKVRKTRASMSSGWYVPGDRQLHSTYLVCRKAIDLCETPEDRAALLYRLRYEHRQALFSGNPTEAELFYQLARTLSPPDVASTLYHGLEKIPLPWSTLRRWYQRWRFG